MHKLKINLFLLLLFICIKVLRNSENENTSGRGWLGVIRFRCERI